MKQAKGNWTPVIDKENQGVTMHQLKTLNKC